MKKEWTSTIAVAVLLLSGFLSTGCEIEKPEDETTTTTTLPPRETTTTTMLLPGETITTTVPSTTTTLAPGATTTTTTTTTIPDPPLLVAGLAPTPPSASQAVSDPVRTSRAPLERIMSSLMTSVEVVGSPALSSLVLTGLVVWLSMRGLEGSPEDSGKGRRRRWVSRLRRRR